jgi:ribosomal protein L7/L12
MFTDSANERRIAELESRLARLEQRVDMIAGRLGFGDPGAMQPGMTDMTEIEQMLRKGQKIEAIKIYRQKTGVGLKEAKDAVEAMERRMW